MQAVCVERPAEGPACCLPPPRGLASLPQSLRRRLPLWKEGWGSRVHCAGEVNDGRAGSAPHVRSGIQAGMGCTALPHHHPPGDDQSPEGRKERLTTLLSLGPEGLRGSLCPKTMGQCQSGVPHLTTREAGGDMCTHIMFGGTVCPPPSSQPTSVLKS